MKKLLSLLVVGALLAISTGCSEEQKTSKTKTSATTKEVIKPSGKVETTTEKKEEKREDGKITDKKEEKKTEVK